MNDQGAMFDWGDSGPASRTKLSATAALTARNNTALRRGVHPATGLPLLDHPESERPNCGSCAFAEQFTHNSRSYWKCHKHRLGISRGAATDIRVGWPACVAHHPRTADVSSTSAESMPNALAANRLGDRVPDHGGQT